MKRSVGGVAVLFFGLLFGCAGDSGPASGVAEASRGVSAASAPVMLAAGGEEAVARLPGLAISREKFLAPLIEGHGLAVLLNVAQLELAAQNAQRKGLNLTDDDLRKERERTLAQAFAELDAKIQEQIDAAAARNDAQQVEKLRKQMKVDHEQMLDQLLTQQRVTRPEFELVLRTNAYLRKMAEQEVKEIPEETVRKIFDAEYGATVRVRHIQSNNPAELEGAKRRIDGGEPFEKVAREVSRNGRTGPLGGEVPKFSLMHTSIPDAFKRVAFSLKEGEVSGVVQCDDAYHLIKLEQKFPPKAVKYESVRDALREKAREQVIQKGVVELREQLATQTRENLRIEDPVLREQFKKRLDERDQQIRDSAKIKQQQERERQLMREKQQLQLQGQPPAPQGAPAQPQGNAPAGGTAPAAPQPAPSAPKPAGGQ